MFAVCSGFQFRFWWFFWVVWFLLVGCLIVWINLFLIIDLIFVLIFVDLGGCFCV